MGLSFKYMFEVASVALMATIPVYIIMFCGWMSRRVGWVKAEHDAAIMRIAVEIFFPCFVLKAMFGNSLLASPGFSLMVLGVGFFEILASFAVAWGIAALARFKVGEGKRTFALTCGLQNYGFMVIPLVAVLYPKDATMGVLLTHNVGVEIAMWTVGLLILSDKVKLNWRLLCRGPIIGTVIGLLFVWSGLDRMVPAWGINTLSMLGGCAVPLLIFLIGCTMHDLVSQVKWSFKVVSLGLLARNLVLPLMLLALAVYLPVDGSLKRVLVFQASVPAAMTPIVLARFYGGQPDVAIQIVVASTLASLLSLPLWLAVGLNWIS